MEAPWLPLALGMLKDISYQCTIIKDLIMDVSVGQVFKGLLFLHFTFWLFRYVCCTCKFSSSVCQAGGATQGSTTKFQQQCLKEWAGWCGKEGVPRNTISIPNLADIVIHSFRVGLAWCRIGIYHFTISVFFRTSLSSQGLKSSHHLNECVTSIYSVPLYINSLNHEMLNVYYPCWRTGLQLLLLLLLNLLGRQLPIGHCCSKNCSHLTFYALKICTFFCYFR